MTELMKHRVNLEFPELRDSLFGGVPICGINSNLRCECLHREPGPPLRKRYCWDIKLKRQESMLRNFRMNMNLKAKN